MGDMRADEDTGIDRLPPGVRPETDLSEGLATTWATEDLPAAAPQAGGKYEDMLLDVRTGQPFVLP